MAQADYEGVDIANASVLRAGEILVRALETAAKRMPNKPGEGTSGHMTQADLKALRKG